LRDMTLPFELTYFDILKNAVDIFIIAFIFYRLLLFIRGSRAIQMLFGLILVGLVYLASKYLNLYTTNWILQNFWSVLLIAVIILFQPELRRMLAEVGQRPILSSFFKYEETQAIGEVVKASIALSKKRIGALIVLERETRLRPFIEVGTILTSRVTEELLMAIFQPLSPLHDGAVIIGGNRIFAAGCYLPLTLNVDISKFLGTRHRAGIGITEETDAVAIIVSEETGNISLAIAGKLYSNLNENSLREHLQMLFVTPKKKGKE